MEMTLFEKAGKYMSSFFKGTLILMIAALLTRIMGFVNRMVLARTIGEEGVGIFMMVFPTLILCVTIVQMGLPVAIAKRVAEADIQRDPKKVRAILSFSIGLSLGISLILVPILYFSAPFIANTLFTDKRSTFTILAMIPALPIIAVSSVLRGYFQGKQRMGPTAVSQLIEQVARIIFVYVLTQSLAKYGIEYAAAGAMFATVIGELASLLYLVLLFRIRRSDIQSYSNWKQNQQTIQGLLSVAIPSIGSRLIGSISWFLEPIVVMKSLAIAGVGSALATKQYGSLSGFALPILMLPSFLTLSLSTSLVPAVSEAKASGNYVLLEHRLQRSLKFCVLSGGIAVLVFLLLATPLMKAIYGSAYGANFVLLMAPFILFYYCQGPLSAVLQGLDLAKASMLNSLFGAIIKTACIAFLASRAAWGMEGAAFGISLGMIIVTSFHFRTMIQSIPFTIHFSAYLKYVLAFTLTFMTLKYLLPFVLQNPTYLDLLLSILLIVFVHVVFLISFRLVTKRDRFW